MSVLADLMGFFNCRGTPKRKLSLSSIDTPPACTSVTQEQGNSSESGNFIHKIKCSIYMINFAHMYISL